MRKTGKKNTRSYEKRKIVNAIARERKRRSAWDSECRKNKTADLPGRNILAVRFSKQ